MSLADARIEDRDIGPLWAEHYPKGKDNTRSRTLCRVLCLMIENKAARDLGDDDLMVAIHRLLAGFGIAEDQFYEVEKEMGDW
jgi:hypothetical protein